MRKTDGQLMVPSGGAWKGLKTPGILEALKEMSEVANALGPVLAAAPKEAKQKKSPKVMKAMMDVDSLAGKQCTKLEIAEGVIVTAVLEDRRDIGTS